MNAEYFVKLEADEEVIALVRQSPWARFRRFAFAGLWFILPFFFFFPLLTLGPFGLVIFFVFAGTGGYALLRVYISWKHTMLIVTDRRIIDIDQQSIFQRDIFEVDLADVKGTDIVVGGFWPRIFKLSTVIIQTKRGHEFDIEMEGVKEADRFVELVDDVQCNVGKVVEEKGEDQDEDQEHDYQSEPERTIKPIKHKSIYAEKE